MSEPQLVAAAAVIGAVALDRLFGEPPQRFHPVVWFGRLVAPLGHWALAGGSRGAQWARGALAWALPVALIAGLAWLAQRWLCATLPAAAAAVALAVLLKPTFAWRMLRDEVAAVEQALAGSLDAGRAQVARLCSRDVSALDAEGVRETALESLAENFNDSLAAPLFWFAVGGLAGAVLYRCANALDAMWGYRGRWEWAGKTAARADDLLSWLPARLSALLLAAPRHWLRVAREAARTPSPNGGWPMAALALQLGVRLRKPGVYALNAGVASPAEAHTRQALRLTGRAVVVLTGLTAALAAALHAV